YPCALGQLNLGVLAPRGRQLVEPVAHHLDLVRRQPDPLDRELAQRLADRDHPPEPPCQQPLDVPVRPQPEAVVVVLRIDERRAPARGSRRPLTPPIRWRWTPSTPVADRAAAAVAPAPAARAPRTAPR